MKRKFCFNIINCTLFLSIILFAYNGLINPHLSFDEGGQFWLCKGLYHFASLFQPSGKLIDMMIYNQTWNMDPGGYSIIGFIWLKFGNSIFWIRLLPFLFTLLSLFILSKIIGLLGIPQNEALALSFIFFLSNSLVTYSFTFRAYSFEITGVMILLYLILKFKDSAFDSSNLIRFSLVFNIFLWSRYGFIIAIIITNTIILWLVFLSKKFESKFIKRYFLIVVIPLLLNFGILYFTQMKYHLHGNYVSTYQERYTLMYQDFFTMVNLNFFSRRGLPFLVLTILMTIQFLKGKSFFNENIKTLFFWMLGVHILTMILSFNGLYPWYIKGRWGLTLEFISILSLIIIIIEITKFFRERNCIIKNHFATIFLVFSITLLYCREFKQYNNCIYFLTKFKNSKSKSAWVSGYLVPTTKYNLKYNHNLKSIENLKLIQLDGINIIESKPKSKTWFLISNDNSRATQSFLRTSNFTYKIIFNEPADKIIEVVE